MKRLMALLLLLSLLAIPSFASLDFATRGSNYINCGSPSSIDNLAASSAIMWIYPTSVTATDYGLMGIGTFAGQTRKDFTFNTSNSTLTFVVDRATTDTNSSGSFTWSANTWYCVAYTWDGTSAAQIYVGTLTSTIAEVGSYVTQTTGAGTPTDSSAATYYIGNIGLADRSIIGRVAVAQLYDRALSLGELRTLQFSPKKLSGCVLYFQAGFNGTSTQHDISGNGNSGTVTNGSVASHVPLGAPFGN